MLGASGIMLVALGALAAPVFAQSRTARDSAARADSARARGGSPVTSLSQVTITATRTAQDVFDAPSAVSVIDSATMHSKLPNTVVDAFRDLPGLDITGVGTNQAVEITELAKSYTAIERRPMTLGRNREAR